MSNTKRPVAPLPLDDEAPDRLELRPAAGLRLKLARVETEDGRLVSAIAACPRPRKKRARIRRKVKAEAI